MSISPTQDIINVIAWQWPQLFHTLPCLWNVQLNDAAVYEKCPFRWLSNATTSKLPEIRALHMNREEKRHFEDDEKYYRENKLALVDNCELVHCLNNEVEE